MSIQKSTVFLIFCIYFILSPQVSAREIAKTVLVNGKVEAIKGTTTRILKANQPVHDDETIKTGTSGSAKILFRDQTIINIGPSSSLELKDFSSDQSSESRSATFSLAYGKLRALVTKKVGKKGRVKFKTRDATMGVRGTEFVMEAPRPVRGGRRLGSSGTRIAVLSGTVEATYSGGTGPVSLGAGQALRLGSTLGTTSSGAQVSDISVGEMDTLAEETTTSDNTFTEAVKIEGEEGETEGVREIVSLFTNEEPPDLPEDIEAMIELEMHETIPPVEVIPGNLVNVRVTIQ